MEQEYFTSQNAWNQGIQNIYWENSENISEICKINWEEIMHQNWHVIQMQTYSSEVHAPIQDSDKQTGTVNISKLPLCVKASVFKTFL